MARLPCEAAALVHRAALDYDDFCRSLVQVVDNRQGLLARICLTVVVDKLGHSREPTRRLVYVSSRKQRPTRRRRAIGSLAKLHRYWVEADLQHWSRRCCRTEAHLAACCHHYRRRWGHLADLHRQPAEPVQVKRTPADGLLMEEDMDYVVVASGS